MQTRRHRALVGTGMMWVLHRSASWWGQGNEGGGDRDGFLWGGSQGQHGALGRGPGVVIAEMEEEDRLGLSLSSCGVRGEAAGKTGTFGKKPVCCLGVLKEPSENLCVAP